MAIFAGPSGLLEIRKALGIPEWQRISKIVLEFSTDSVARAYIQGYVKQDALPGICEVIAVKSVSVEDDCTVVYEK